MAKLSVVINAKFSTKGFIAHDHEKFVERNLTADEVKALFAEIDSNELGISLLGHIPGEQGLISIDLRKTQQKKRGGEFLVNLNPDASGLDVELAGEWVAKLRSGAEKTAKLCDWYLQGVTYNGGSWRGFLSPLEGQVDAERREQFTNERGYAEFRTWFVWDGWHKISDAAVK